MVLPDPVAPHRIVTSLARMDSMMGCSSATTGRLSRCAFMPSGRWMGTWKAGVERRGSEVVEEEEEEEDDFLTVLVVDEALLDAEVYFSPDTTLEAHLEPVATAETAAAAQVDANSLLLLLTR